MRRIPAVLLMFVVACTTTGVAPGSPPVTPGSSTTTLVSSATSSTSTTTPLLLTDGVTVTDDVIHLGMLADLSGPFASASVDAVDAQIAFWDRLNQAGGIAGRRIELHIADTRSDPQMHVQKYEELMPVVAMFTLSMGSEPTLALASRLGADQRLVIPFSSYSGWSDPFIGSAILETGPSWCVQAINAVTTTAQGYRQEQGRAPRLAILSDPGYSGQDAAEGARFAAESLGVPLVYDGEARLVPGTDLAPVIAAVGRSGADLVWVSTDPVTLATLIAGSVQLGFSGQWLGNSSTFDSRLLDTALGDLISRQAIVTYGAAPLGSEVSGMSGIVEVLADSLPDRYPADAMITGYLQFELASSVLQRAAELGDLTPRGLTAAARTVGSMSFAGVAPPVLYSDDPNLGVSRASATGHLDKGLFEAQGGLQAHLGGGAVSPVVLDGEFVATDLSTRYDFSTPCYLPPGTG